MIREARGLGLGERGGGDADAGRGAGEAVGGSRRKYPAALHERADGSGLLGDGDPHVQPGGAVGADAVALEAREQVAAALGVGGAGAGDERVDGGVAPEGVDERLEDVADPARTTLLAALDAGDGTGVAGEDRQAQVGAERLGDRACGRPPLAAGDERVQRTAGDGAEVVVFDEQRAGEALEHGAQLQRAGCVESCAERVLPAGGDDGGERAAPEGAIELDGEHAAVIDGDRLQREAVGAQEVVEGGVAGVLDGDAVAGAQVREQDALDRVEGAAGDAQVLAGDAVGAELLAGERHEPAERLRLAVEVDGQLATGERGAEVGQQRGVGVAEREVAGAGRHGQRRAREPDRRAGADAGAAPGLAEDDPAPAQLGESSGDGDGAQPHLGGEAPDGWQALPGDERAAGDSRLDGADELRRTGRLDAILFWLSQHAVLLQIF
jgi:hypothetical protein